MKSLLTHLAGWFTDSRRAGAQALVASIASLLVVLGAVSDVQSAALLDLSASGLLAVQGALGLLLLRGGDVYTWLNTTGRGLVYSLGAAIGAAGFMFSLWSADTSALILQVSTVVASILVAAVQMVNVGTLSAPPVGDLPDEVLARFAAARAANAAVDSADAERTVEESPATFDKERDPEWVPPLAGLSVGIFAPKVEALPHLSVVRGRFAPTRVSKLDVFARAEDMRGRSYDVVLTTVELTRGLLETFEPNVAASTYEGQRVQHLEGV